MLSRTILAILSLPALVFSSLQTEVVHEDVCVVEMAATVRPRSSKHFADAATIMLTTPTAEPYSGTKPTVNVKTDGADTVYADNITFRRWTIGNGDDSIAMNANSTNILIEDCDFYTGLGVAIGSISP